MRLLRKLLLVLLVLFLLGVAALGYLGVIPGVSSLLKTDQPRDLGVRPTAADAESGLKKLLSAMREIGELPPATSPEASIYFEGAVDVAAEFTAEEITALVQNRRWSYWPATSFQGRIAEDGTCEVSAVIIVDRLPSFARATGIAPAVIEQALRALPVKGNFPVFARGTLFVENNTVHIGLEKLEIGRMRIPRFIVRRYLRFIERYAEDQIARMGITVRSLRAADRKIFYDGTFPAVYRRLIAR